MPNLYTILGAFLILSLVSGAALYYRGNSIEADARAAAIAAQLDRVIATNELQQKAIDNLVDIRNVVNEISANLNDEFDQINKQFTDSNQALSDLKESDPDAKSFLRQSIPSGVDRLHVKPKSNN